LLSLVPGGVAEAQMPPTAKSEYQRGAGLYKTRHFAAAAQAFASAYAKYPSTRLLYDLGQTYRKQGQLQQALQSYEQYLATERQISPAMQMGVRSYVGQLRAALGKPVSGPVLHPKVMPDLLDPALGPRPPATPPALPAAPAAASLATPTPTSSSSAVAAAPAPAPAAGRKVPAPIAPTAVPMMPAGPAPAAEGGPAAMIPGSVVVESLPRRQLPGKWSIIDPKPGYILRRAYCGPADVFVVGDSSTVLAAADGQAVFGPLRTGLPNWFSAVWGTAGKSAGGGELFIGGDSGLVLRRVGPQLHAVPSGIRGTVFAFAGSATDWFAFGEAGAAARFDGSAFVAVPAATPNAILGAFAVDNEVFAVGAGGAILRWGGASFTSMPSPTRAMLQGIWGPSKSELWAVGTQGTILRFDGSGWRSVPSGTAQTLLAIWGAAKNDVYAVGTAGLVMHYDGSSWAAVDLGAGSLLAGVALSGLCGRAGGEVFATGDNLILRYKK
jgi:hypothetical protein